VDELRNYIDTLPFFDSHSHMAGFDVGTPLDDKQGRSLPQILVNDYLQYLSGSCCDTTITSDVPIEQAEEHFRSILPLLDVCRGMTTYTVYREAIRELHPYEGDDIALDNWAAINEQVVRAYQQYGERAWQREVVRRAGVVKQAHMCQLAYVVDHWSSLPEAERAAQAAYLVPCLFIDGYFFGGFDVCHEGRRRSLEILDARPTTHGQYVAFCGQVLDRFIREGGRAVKLVSAYVRTLKFEDVPDAVAEPLFARGPESLEGDDRRRLEDNLLWHLVRMAKDRGLPLLVHTGYTTPTEWGDPEHLLDIIGTGINVALLHSGWPREGGAMLLARSRRNCYFDMCWTPLLSPTLARHIMGMAIDMLPMNKIMIGTDCGSAEAFFGTVKLVRQVLYDVLAEKVHDGQFGTAVARKIARAILHDTAAEFFATKRAETAS